MSMLDYTQWLELDPFVLSAADKSKMLMNTLNELTTWHNENCVPYQRVLHTLGFNPAEVTNLGMIPFLPVRLFKEYELLSIKRDLVFKTMTSSGTSGQRVSKIFLDRETASLQTRVLSKIMSSVLGKKRLPMLIVDSPSVLKDRNAFSARGAGILGFSMFGTDVTYALDDQMNLDLEAVERFLLRHRNEPIFIFGFTFMIWQYLYLPLQQRNIHIRLDNAIILHGGGWKKLENVAVNNLKFKSELNRLTGISKVFNYYGMVEQTGSLFIECSMGHLHAPVYADVIIRKPGDFSVAAVKEEGLIEVLSIIPRSYPGHALLTEDRGVILGEDDCQCGRLGKYFQVLGRVAKSEVRGCSDTHEFPR